MTPARRSPRRRGSASVRILGAIVAAFVAWVAWQSVARIRTVRARAAAEEPAPRESRGGLPDAAEAAARADSAWRRIAEDGAGTWLPAMIAGSDSVLRRWPSRRDRPVTVWLQEAASLPDWRPDLYRQAQAGFEAWGLDAAVPIRFLVVADSSSAEVALVWVTRFGDQRVGATRTDTWNDTIVRGVVTIALRGLGDRVLSDADVRRTAMHEAGHLLGLLHSDEAGSIMTPASLADQPTPRDFATLRLLYAVPFGSVRPGGARPPGERYTTEAAPTTSR